MIETERLVLQPLTYEQLLKYTRADHSLEEELGLHRSVGLIPPMLIEAIDYIILPNAADPNKNYLFSTLWTIILKAEQKMVGDICIAGEPNAAGEIEIGYGIYDEFQNQGYMTEAVAAIISWAASQPNVNSIKASASKDNVASIAVLQKNNFKPISETDILINWKLVLKKES